MSHRCLTAVLLLALAVPAMAPTALAAETPTLAASPPAQTVGPGSPALFTLTLSNPDILPQSYALSIANASLVPGWTHSFEPAQLDVEAKKSASSTLVLSPGNDTVGGPFNFTILATATGPVSGGAVATASVEVTVEPPTSTTSSGTAPVEPLRLALATGDATGAPGETAEGGLTVVSNDPRALRLDFDISGPASWQPRVADGFRIMYQGQILQSRLSVVVPAGVADGTLQTFTVTATDRDLGKSVSTIWRVTASAAEQGETTPPAPSDDSASASPTPAPTTAPSSSPSSAPPPSVAVRLDILQSSVEVRAGESGANQLQIANIGTLPVRVELTGIGHATWDRFAFLNDSNMPITELDLGVGITRYIAFTWDVPREIPPSTIGARVTARGLDNADLVKTVSFEIKVLAALELPPPTSPKTTDAATLEGDSATVAVPASWGVAAGLGAVGVGALALARRPVREKLLWGAVGLYTRLARPDILGHDEREKLYRIVETNPGVHFHALQRELGWNTGTLTYHLRVLEKHGFLVSRKDGLYRRFYVQGAAPRKETFVDGPTGLRADVLEAIRGQHGMSQTDLSLALGANKQTVNYHVKALERSGLIRVEKRGRETFLYPADAPSGSEPAAA